MSHPTRRVRAVAALLGVALLVGSAAALASLPGADAAGLTPVDGSATGPDPYFPSDGNGGYQVEHYTIDDRYRPGTDELTGRTTLSAVVGDSPLSSFHLDLRLTPDSVTVQGQEASFSKPSGHELKVVPAIPLPAGSAFEAVVTYHGRPARLPSATPWDGFFRSDGETAAVGEPQIGPWWFAANETPSDKATYDVTIRVPRGQQAVGNGRLVSRTVGSTWTAWRWRQAEPISTYLAFFVAGRFALRQGTADGRPTVYAASMQLTSKQRDRSFRLMANTPRVLRWMADRWGPYPYSAAGGVMSGVFTGFALENASRPFYSWFGGPGSIDLIVHELAHQWFGDTVGLRLWRDTWLNEGFATYAEWLWAEDHGGPTVQRQLLDTYGRYPGSSPFWGLVVSDPGRARIFDAPVYERGAMMLAALRCRFGKAPMRDLLRDWVDRHRDGSAGGGTGTGQEFRDLAETRGQLLQEFFRVWLDKKERPQQTADNGLTRCA